MCPFFYNKVADKTVSASHSADQDSSAAFPCTKLRELTMNQNLVSLTSPPKLMIVKLVSEQSADPLLRPTVSICMKLLALIRAMNRG